jgi:hypothetical protein
MEENKNLTNVSSEAIGSKALGLHSQDFPIDPKVANHKPLPSLIKFGVSKKILKWLGVFWQECFVFPCYILTHPIGGWTKFKEDKKGKMSVAIFILAMYILMKMIEYQYQGQVINTNNPLNFNSITILIYGALPAILLSVANWSVTTLMDGKGKMKEIFMMICYSYFPIMILGFINIALSNIVTTDESQFITLINIVAWFLTGFMAYMGLIVVHEFGFGKTLWSIILTAIAACIICFVALLLFSLFQQIYGFLYSLYREISARWF